MIGQEVVVDISCISLGNNPASLVLVLLFSFFLTFVSKILGIFICLFVLEVPHSLQDLSSLTRDWALSWQWILTPRPPGNPCAAVLFSAEWGDNSAYLGDVVRMESDNVWTILSGYYLLGKWHLYCQQQQQHPQLLLLSLSPILQWGLWNKPGRWSKFYGK